RRNERGGLDMAYNTKKLLTDRNGDPIPQSYDSDGDRYVPSEIDTRLKAIENQQQEILERLDGTFDTQLTGSNVEQDVNVKNYPDTQKVEVTNQQEIPSVEFPSDYPDSKANERLEAIEQTQESIISALQTTNENLKSVIDGGRIQSDAVLKGSNVDFKNTKIENNDVIGNGESESFAVFSSDGLLARVSNFYFR